MVTSRKSITSATEIHTRAAMSPILTVERGVTLMAVCNGTEMGATRDVKPAEPTGPDVMTSMVATRIGTRRESHSIASRHSGGSRGSIATTRRINATLLAAYVIIQL